MTEDAAAVAAHDQTEARKYTMHFPPHPARAADPHYVDFNHYHKTNSPTARCAVALHFEPPDAPAPTRQAGVPHRLIGIGEDIAQCDLRSPMELHHAHVEFSLQNGVDLVALEHDYPGISDPSTVGAWVESGANFEWLCVLPGSPVLMADGTKRAIEDVLPGDWVIGGHGRPDLVTATSRKRYSGEVARLGPTALTTPHRVATDRGWLPVGQVADEIGMLGSDVIRLRCIEDEVGWSVVRPVPIDVVDALTGEQSAVDDSFHDRAVLHDQPVSVPDADVATRSYIRGALADVPLRQGVQGSQPAGVGTVALLSLPPVGPSLEGLPAVVAEQSRGLGWLTVDHPVRALHTGWVHDLSIAHSHSFVVGGLVVHNCAFHHRGHGGKHNASSSDFEAERYVRGLIT